MKTSDNSAPMLQLQPERHADGYGTHPLFRCDVPAPRFSNRGYNVFLDSAFTKARLSAVPTDDNGASQHFPLWGWVWVQFADKLEKIFLSLDMSGDPLVYRVEG